MPQSIANSIVRRDTPSMTQGEGLGSHTPSDWGVPHMHNTSSVFGFVPDVVTVSERWDAVPPCTWCRLIHHDASTIPILVCMYETLS